jgi:hypothetical protein
LICWVAPVKIIFILPQQPRRSVRSATDTKEYMETHSLERLFPAAKLHSAAQTQLQHSAHHTHSGLLQRRIGQ